MRKRLAQILAAAALLAAPLAFSPTQTSANANSGTGGYAFGLYDNDPSTYCSASVRHLIAYGGAVGQTYNTSCWSTYTTVVTTSGSSAGSSAGNPGSSVYIGGATPSNSLHTACFGLYNCQPALSWH